MTGDLALLLGTVSLSPVEVVLSLIVCIFAARYAYRAAVRFRAQAGVTPWHLPPGLWAFVFFCSWLIGLLLFAIARRTTRPVLSEGQAASHLASGPAPATGEGAGAPRGADGAQLGPGEVPGVHGPPGHLPYAGWYHDPGGRHELRYWDGKGWTDYVSDQGVRSEDPG